MLIIEHPTQNKHETGQYYVPMQHHSPDTATYELANK